MATTTIFHFAPPMGHNVVGGPGPAGPGGPGPSGGNGTGSPPPVPEAGIGLGPGGKLPLPDLTGPIYGSLDPEAVYARAQETLRKANWERVKQAIKEQIEAPEKIEARGEDIHEELMSQAENRRNQGFFSAGATGGGALLSGAGTLKSAKSLYKANKAGDLADDISKTKIDPKVKDLEVAQAKQDLELNKLSDDLGKIRQQKALADKQVSESTGGLTSRKAGEKKLAELENESKAVKQQLKDSKDALAQKDVDLKGAEQAKARSDKELEDAEAEVTNNERAQVEARQQARAEIRTKKEANQKALEKAEKDQQANAKDLEDLKKSKDTNERALEQVRDEEKGNAFDDLSARGRQIDADIAQNAERGKALRGDIDRLKGEGQRLDETEAQLDVPGRALDGKIRSLEDARPALDARRANAQKNVDSDAANVAQKRIEHAEAQSQTTALQGRSDKLDTDIGKLKSALNARADHKAEIDRIERDIAKQERVGKTEMDKARNNISRDQEEKSKLEREADQDTKRAHAWTMVGQALQAATAGSLNMGAAAFGYAADVDGADVSLLQTGAAAYEAELKYAESTAESGKRLIQDSLDKETGVKDRKQASLDAISKNYA